MRVVPKTRAQTKVFLLWKYSALGAKSGKTSPDICFLIKFTPFCILVYLKEGRNVAVNNETSEK